MSGREDRFWVRMPVEREMLVLPHAGYNRTVGLCPSKPRSSMVKILPSPWVDETNYTPVSTGRLGVLPSRTPERSTMYFSCILAHFCFMKLHNSLGILDKAPPWHMARRQ